jgi:hypothetical protein
LGDIAGGGGETGAESCESLADCEEGPATATGRDRFTEGIVESDVGLMVRRGEGGGNMEGRGEIMEDEVGPGTDGRIYIDCWMRLRESTLARSVRPHSWGSR